MKTRNIAIFRFLIETLLNESIYRFRFRNNLFNRHIISTKSRGFLQTPQDIMEEYNGCSVPQYTAYGRVSFSSEGVQRVVSACTDISEWILSREKLNLNKMGNAFEYNPPLLYQSR